ncbi:hypothetical protein BT96DRAFT_760802, partial [Gymnopus androsaceus JB14]
WLAISTIVGGLVAGIIVAMGNHFFFSLLNGKRTDLYCQFWITTAKNILPKVVQVAFGMSMGCSLTPAVWYHVGHHLHTLPQLDHLFALSVPLSLLRLIFSRQIIFLLPLVIIEIAIQSLSLLPIFVPGALTIESAAAQSVIAKIPTLDLSSIYPPIAVEMSHFESNFMEPSTLFKEVIQAATTTDVARGWSAPNEICSSALTCSYSFNYSWPRKYNAPALQCTNLPSTAIGDGMNASSGPISIVLYNREHATAEDTGSVYNATFTLDRAVDPIEWLDTWNQTYLYNLTIACIPHFGLENPLALQAGELPPVGSSCVFWNATYSATTEFANNTQSTSAQILSYNSPLSPWDCLLEATCYDSWNNYIVGLTDTLSPDASFAIASHAMAETFVDMFLGNLSFVGFTGAFMENGDTTSALYTPLFSINSTALGFDLTAPAGNLSQGLTNLFTNTTQVAFISLASNLTDPSVPTTPLTLVAMDFTPLFNQYHYIQWKLFLIYGLTVSLVAVAGVYGVWCMQVDVHPRTMNFSEVVAATRHVDVDLALMKDEGTSDVRLQY